MAPQRTMKAHSLGNDIPPAQRSLGGERLSPTLRAHVSHLRRSAFVKNVMVVMTGTAVAQIIGFALSPVVSRLFTPSDFGVFGSFGAVSGVIAAAATLEYTQAIMLPKRQDDAVNIFLVACVCTLAAGAVCLCASLIAPSVLHGLMQTSGFWMLALLVVTTLVNGLNQACQAWCVRVKAFTQTSASQVVRSLSSNGAQVGFGFLGAGAPGLIISTVLANALATVNLLGVLLPALRAQRHSIGWGRMAHLAREYRDFPQYAATTNVMNTLSLGLPVLLLTHYFGIAAAGAYAFAERIISTPMSFVTRALRQVLFQKACEIHNEGGRLLPLFLKITGGMFAVAALPSAIFMAWAPPLFGWVFGPEWQTAGKFAQSLTLWLLFMFCNLPSVLFARIIRIQNRMFAFDVVLLAARSLALIAGGIFLSATQTVLLFSLVGAGMNLVFIVMVGRALYSREGDVDWAGLSDALEPE
jgi:lipopolysaccharide exporter